MEREKLEWTDTWWEQSGDLDAPRFLLIGDSIARDYHPPVRDTMRGLAHVDRFTTSKFAADPFFTKEIALYLEEYQYTAIHLNHGLHGAGFPLEIYAKAYEELVKRALKHCENLILAASTPVAVRGDLSTLNPDRTPVITARNAVVAELATGYGLPYNDLYTCVAGVAEYKVDDGTHFNTKGSAVLAERVVTALKKYL